MAWIKVAVLLLSVVCFSSALKRRSEEDIRNRNAMLKFLDENEEAIITEIQNFTKTGYQSEKYLGWMKSIPFSVDMANEEIPDYTPEQAFLTCLACRTIGATFIRDRHNGATVEELANSANNICTQITPFTAPVCRGIIDLNAHQMAFIIDARPQMTATQMCGFILQSECGAVDPVFAFTVNVNPGNPITAPKSVSVPRNANELRIIHITDLHHDPSYLVGGQATCVNPVCCRRSDGPATNPADAAGRWGSYSCNTPWEALEQTIRAIRRDHPVIDMVYHTGDIIDHGIWETTEAGNIAIMDRVYNLLREVFGNIPVYSVIANHEAQPTNLFAPPSITRPDFSTRWLYEYKANTWARHGWLSGAALNTVRAGGYYTTLIQPGLRLIGLNNNDCYTFNWWVMYSRNEAQQNMQWLHNTLLAAEIANERVHILAHIPTGGGSCYEFWSREYRRVIDRFHNIIGAQFNGHSHRSDFEIYYDRPSAQHAVNVAWNAGSTTTFTNVNPNYHLYYVDRTHFQVQDMESWMYSIPEANANPTALPRWFRHYSLRDAFGLTDTSPAALDRLAFDISRDRNLSRRYREFKVKNAAPRLACDDDCLRSEVCGLVNNEHMDFRRCDQVLAVFGTVA